MHYRFWLGLLYIILTTTGCGVADSGIAQESSSSKSAAPSGGLWSRPGLDWPSFLGPERNGKSAETDLRFDWAERPPQVVWSQRVGEGYGSGAVANGRYFHFDRTRDQARLRAFHAENGELLWEFSYPTSYTDMYGFDGGPRGSPVVDGDRVYIHGVEGMLYCINAETGKEVWRVDTAEEFGVVQNFFGAGSTPLVHKDLLITMVGGSPPESRSVPFGRLAEVKPNGNGIVAFDKLTGEVRYVSVNDLASYASPVIGEINGKATGLAFMRSGLVAFDPDSGEVGFEFPFRARKFESVNASTPIITNGKVLITESYGLGGALLEIKDGVPDVIWADQGGRNQALACHWNTPIVVDGYAYASSGEKQSQAMLRCVRMSDGHVMWDEPGLTRSSLTLADDHLICLCENGKLFAFKPDPNAFQVTTQIDVSDLRLLYPCWASPIVSHGYLYVRGKSKVWCLDIAH
ncbi:MAG: PQQ-binding-like beta-propeller repeat protein [Pirellulaceae bacterium]|nr:PQQ-binding-like beta-propeller repeat protein [Pirellulaceae bacterium]